jgi:hypothetical protein
MTPEPARDDWLDRKVRDWLLAVLRFAMTGEEGDREAIVTLAEEMDRLGWWPIQSPFQFFSSTSTELCRALAKLDDPDSLPVLRRHLKRIADPRIEHAMAAAVGIQNLVDRAPKKASAVSQRQIARARGCC